MPHNPNCDLCPLGERAAHRCIWGSHRLFGGAHPTGFVVGEAPGWQENSAGVPFVGKSGRLLDDTLREIGLSDAYVTNVVKCVSDGAPPPDSIKACLPYLDEEIAERRPKAILALGATAWHRLGGKGAITEAAGKEIWSKKYDCWIMPALHPAAILRAQGRKASWKLVINRYAKLLDGGLHAVPPVKVHVIKNEDQIAWLRNNLGRGFSFDFETSLLPWWHKDFKAKSVAFSFRPGEAFVLPIDQQPADSKLTPADVRWLVFRGSIGADAIKEFMRDPSIRKTAHNMLFDDLVWYRLAGYLPHTTTDTMVIRHLLDENGPKGLKWLGRTLLGWPDWDIDPRKEHGFGRLAFYNGCDTAATEELCPLLLRELRQDDRLYDYYLLLVMPGLRAVEGLMARGIHVDVPALEGLIISTAIKMDGASLRLPVENPASTKQLIEWLYMKEGLPVLATTPKGAPTTNEETIHRLAREFPAAKDVLDFREHAKNQGTYLLPLRTELRDSVDGRSHPEYRIGPETGRLASRFHTVPRDPVVRSVYTDPPGRTLVVGDYSQIEARLAAWRAAGSPSTWDAVDPLRAALMFAFKNGLDPYKMMAGSALNKPVETITKDERQMMGKVPTLAMIYRISVQGFRDYAWRKYQIDYSFAQAEHLHRTFYNLWPELRDWHDDEERAIVARGYTFAPCGRRRRLPDAQGYGQEGKHEAINSGINMPIQTTAWDITNQALILATKAGLEMVGTVHDSLMASTDDALKSWAVAMMAKCMRIAPDKLRLLGLMLPEDYIRFEISTGPWGAGEVVLNG